MAVLRTAGRRAYATILVRRCYASLEDAKAAGYFPVGTDGRARTHAGIRPTSPFTCPPEYPVKAWNSTAGAFARQRFYVVPGQFDYPGASVDVCFASIQDAETAGYRRLR